MKRLLRFVRGDLARYRADVIVTSTNAQCSGNANPSYWRFTGKKNVDGAIREAMDEVHTSMHTSANGKPAPNAPKIPSVGGAVAIPARGRLLLPEFRVQHVIATLVPEGAYGYGNDAMRQSEKQLSECYSNTLLLAEALLSQLQQQQATSSPPTPFILAFPALGCGVREWKTSRAAEIACSAIFNHCSSSSSSCSGIGEIHFVFFDHGVFRTWVQIGDKMLSTRGDKEQRENEFTWLV